jgi:acetyl-CoA decarbonylase/synthase complex subunit delta
MPFTDKPQVFNAKINEFKLGSDGKEVSLGGYSVYPLYSFDGDFANPVRVAVQISDRGYDASIPGFAAFYEGCDTIAAQAKKASQLPGADFVVLSLDSADPVAENTSVEDCVALAKEVYEAIDKPLAVKGCKNMDKDTELFSAIANELQGKNILFLSCKEEDYKTIATSAVMAYGQSVGGESAVDINLAKQLNVLISQMGINMDKVVMDLGSAASGYGFEYLSSTIERVKNAALTQNDAMLQMPVITMIGDDAWSVKEALLEEADMPEWGSREERGIQMEIVTASAAIASGTDCVILKHPDSVKTISEMIAGIM